MGSIGRNESYKQWTDTDAKQEYSKYDYDVTSEEWIQSTKYTGGRYYTAIQKALLTGEMNQKTYRDGIVDMKPYIDNLDKSMRPLSSNVELIRNISGATSDEALKGMTGISGNTILRVTGLGKIDAQAKKELDSVIGKPLPQKTYVSTSYSAKQNALPGAQVQLKMQVPKGTMAIVTSNKQESEIILHRNLNYVITGYKLEKNSYNRWTLVFETKVIK